MSKLHQVKPDKPSRPVWVRRYEELPEGCGSDQRSELGQGIWKLCEQLGSLSDFVRQVAEGWHKPHQAQRLAKLHLKALKSSRLMADGKTHLALELFWNNDDVTEKEAWDVTEMQTLPGHMEKYTE